MALTVQINSGVEVTDPGKNQSRNSSIYRALSHSSSPRFHPSSLLPLSRTPHTKPFTFTCPPPLPFRHSQHLLKDRAPFSLPMSSDLTPFFLPTSHNNYLSFHLSSSAFLCLLLLAAVFAFWLTPGGLAWALSRARAAQPGPAIPGPSGLPLLGLTLPFTSSLTHRTLATLARTFNAGPLMAFSVGLRRFVISSCPDTAKEILNSSAFANRPVKESAYGLLFHRAMGFAPYGEYWRGLRRISSTHLFSPMRVSFFGGFRQEIGAKMVEEINRAGMAGKNAVGVRRVLQFASLNNVMMSVFGKRYDFGGGSVDGEELEWLVREGYELLGMFNWGDYFPVLGWVDLQGVRRRSKKVVERVSVFVGRIIDEHRRERGSKVGGDRHCNDFVDVLLDLEEENRLSDSDMVAVLWVIFYFAN